MTEKPKIDPVQASRRNRLSQLIKDKYPNPRQFALAVKKSEGQINDMLAGRKSFGEKVARDIEARAGLCIGYFDQSPLATEKDFIPDVEMAYGGTTMVAECKVSEPSATNDFASRVDSILRKLLALNEAHPAFLAVEWALHGVEENDTTTSRIRSIDVNASLSKVRSTLNKNRPAEQKRQK